MLAIRVQGRGENGSELSFEREWGGEPILIGREGGCDLVIPEGSVSRRHLRLKKVPEGVQVTDLESANGTWYKGERIGEMVLPPPFTLRIGEHITLTVEEKGVRRLLPFALSRRKRVLFLGGGILLFLLLLLLLPEKEQVQVVGKRRTGGRIELTPIPPLPPERLFLWARLKENDAHFIPGALGEALRAYSALATGESPWAASSATSLKRLEPLLQERLERLRFEALRAYRAREVPLARQVIARLKEEARSYNLRYYEEAVEWERALDRWEGSRE